jgi:hypothetical protein
MTRAAIFCHQNLLMSRGNPSGPWVDTRYYEKKIECPGMELKIKSSLMAGVKSIFSSLTRRWKYLLRKKIVSNFHQLKKGTASCDGLSFFGYERMDLSLNKIRAWFFTLA